MKSRMLEVLSSLDCFSSEKSKDSQAAPKKHQSGKVINPFSGVANDSHAECDAGYPKNLVHHIRALILALLFAVCTVSVSAQTFTIYGGELGRPCIANPTDPNMKPLTTFNVSTVARASNVVTLVLTTTVTLNKYQAITVSGTTPDSGSFNTATIGTSTQPFRLTAAVTGGNTLTYSQTGTNVTTSSSPGTITLANWSAGKDSASKHGFCDPFGFYMWEQSIQVIDFGCGNGTNPCFHKYDTPDATCTGVLTDAYIWGCSTLERLKGWHVNVIGQYSNNVLKASFTSGNYPGDGSPPVKLSYKDNIKTTLEAVCCSVADFSIAQIKEFPAGIKRSMGSFSTTAGNVLGGGDWFDPNFTATADAFFAYKTQAGFNLSYLYNDFAMGVITDDEDDVGLQRSTETYKSLTSGALDTPPGHSGMHFGYLVAISSPRQAAGTTIWNAMIRADAAYADTKFYAKQCWADWLQANSGNACVASKGSGSAARSAGVITMTFGSAHPFIPNEVVTLTGCSDTTFNTVAGTGVVISNVTGLWPGATATNTTFTATFAGAGTSATGCTVTAGPGYASIAAVNTAWGSSYGGFGTSGTTVTGESIGTGNGSSTSFAHTLAHAPDPDTIQVFDAGTLEGGDGPVSSSTGPLAVSPTQAGTFRGAGVNSGSSSVTYNTGATTTVFAAAPANGHALTANYIWGGWGTGTGLLDEDGHNAWMPTVGTDALTGANAALQADLNHFYVYVSKQYHSVLRSKLDKYLPGKMLFGILTTGNFCTPATTPFIQGAVPYLDVMGENAPVCGISTAGQTDLLRETFRVNAMVPYKRGIWSWEGITANADSAKAGNADPSTQYSTISTQSARATQYTTDINNTQGMAVSGEFYRVGMGWWNICDQQSEGANWGVTTCDTTTTTNADNSYDGVEPASGTVTCGAPLASYTCGSEPAPSAPGVRPYGNFTTTFNTDNQLWFTSSPPPTTGCAVGSGAFIGSGSIICEELTVNFTSPTNPLKFTFQTPNTLNLTVAASTPNQTPPPPVNVFPLEDDITFKTPKSPKGKIWTCTCKAIFTSSTTDSNSCTCQ